MLFYICMIASIGLILCCYSLYIESRIAQDTSYKPACDLSNTISCSRPFLSPYSKLLGISNSYFGLIFYITIIILSIYNQIGLIFYLSISACIASAILAYILYFKIKSLCILCSSIYAINLILLIISYLQFQKLL